MNFGVNTEIWPSPLNKYARKLNRILATKMGTAEIHEIENKGLKIRGHEGP
jgi:hypothetical protein